MKKVVQSGDTACLQPTLDVFRHEDRQLLRGHCHARALAILRARPSGAEGTAHTREAIAYLSLAIFAAGRSCPPASGVPTLCQVPRAREAMRGSSPLSAQGECVCAGAPRGVRLALSKALAVQVSVLKRGRGARPAGT